MNYISLPIRNFAVCSENEDVLFADDVESYEQAKDLLNKTRDEQPDVSWNIFAEIDA